MDQVWLLMHSYEQFGIGDDKVLGVYETEALADAQLSTKQALICLKIAEEENLGITEEELNSVIEEKYAQYNYASAEDFRTAIDTEAFKDDLLLDKVVDFLVENATITEVPEITE